MTRTECGQLDNLLEVAAEEPCPLSDWEQQFVQSLDAKRQYALSEKQAECFDRLVTKHLRGGDE